MTRWPVGCESPQHGKDFYDWYRSIADTPGVTLVNTVYYGQDILTRWTGVCETVLRQILLVHGCLAQLPAIAGG